MIVRGLAIVCVLANVARADATYEQKAQGALHVSLDELAWTLVAKCSNGDDFEKRQCRLVRDARAAALRGKVLAIDGDAKALSIDKFNGKKANVLLDSKLRVDAVDVDGAKWFATGKGLENHVAFSSGAGMASRAFNDADEVERYKVLLGTFRVEWLIQLDAQGSWWSLVGVRVIAPCDGSIVIAQPPSQKVAGDPKRCTPAPVAQGPKGTSDDTIDALRALTDAARACFAKHRVAGEAKLRFTVNADGTVASYARDGFADSPTGACIDAAAKKVKFPRGDRAQTITYPLILK